MDENKTLLIRVEDKRFVVSLYRKTPNDGKIHFYVWRHVTDGPVIEDHFSFDEAGARSEGCTLSDKELLRVAADRFAKKFEAFPE